MLDSPVPMRVRDLVTCPRHGRPLLTLVDATSERWQVTLWLSVNEADRLARVLGVVPHRCVAIFDLVDSLLASFDGRVASVLLDADDNGIGAMLTVEDGARSIEIACHPADALALATRCAAPVYASPATMRHARPIG